MAHATMKKRDMSVLETEVGASLKLRHDESMMVCMTSGSHACAGTLLIVSRTLYHKGEKWARA
jgi:hypothetical protein